MTMIRNETFGVLAIEPSGPYGLLDVVKPVDVDGKRDLPWTGTDIARSYACGDLISFGEACPPIDFDPEGPNAKRFDPLEPISGTLVTLEGGMACSTFGLTPDKAIEYSRSLFEARESDALEREFLDHVLTNDENPTLDLTPDAGPVNVKAGLAIAEGYGIARYGGKPYLHTPATVGSYLAALGSIKLDGTAKTKLDNPLVIGGGYDLPSVGPDGEAAADGTYWLYVSGRPVIVRAKLNVRESAKYEFNEQLALAERGYVIAVDCFVAAVNVILEG